MLLLAPLAGFQLTVGSFLLAVLVLGILAFGMTAMGFWFAWKIDSVQGFHGVMNILLFPMWLLSGALVPRRRRVRGDSLGHDLQSAALWRRRSAPCALHR